MSKLNADLIARANLALEASGFDGSIDENTTETDVSILMALAADGYAGDNEIEAQAVDMMTEVWRVMRGIHQASDTLPGPIPPPPPPHTES
jgi:hypothetical protein